jgi:hypothetical protein
MLPVTVMLDTEALEEGGEQHVPNALICQDARGEQTQPMAVRASLSRPHLVVQRHALNFGLIGRTDIESAPLQVTNRGTGELEWRSEVRGTWLEVVPPNGSCGAGETCTIQVRAYALAVEGESGTAWLTIQSNGGRVDLPASVALSSPQLSVEPLFLSLDSENYEPAVQTLRVTNRGVGTLTGTIQAQVPWLSCEPGSFDCATGAAVEVEVKANVEDLREGTYDARDALLVESNGGTATIDARLALTLTPGLHLSPQELTFESETQAVLWIENRGYGTLRVQILPSEPWLTVNREEWTIKARKRARVRVQVSDAPADAVTTIVVRTAEGDTHLPVRCLPPTSPD